MLPASMGSATPSPPATSPARSPPGTCRTAPCPPAASPMPEHLSTPTEPQHLSTRPHFDVPEAQARAHTRQSRASSDAGQIVDTAVETGGEVISDEHHSRRGVSSGSTGAAQSSRAQDDADRARRARERRLQFLAGSPSLSGDLPTEKRAASGELVAHAPSQADSQRESAGHFATKENEVAEDSPQTPKADIGIVMGGPVEDTPRGCDSVASLNHSGISLRLIAPVCVRARAGQLEQGLHNTSLTPTSLR
jgi:hypothetical protein